MTGVAEQSQMYAERLWIKYIRLFAVATMKTDMIFIWVLNISQLKEILKALVLWWILLSEKRLGENFHLHCKSHKDMTLPFIKPQSTLEWELPFLWKGLWTCKRTSFAKLKVHEVRVFPQNKSSWPKAMQSYESWLFSTIWKSGRFFCLREHAHYSNNFQMYCIYCQEIIHLSKQFLVSDVILFST